MVFNMGMGRFQHFTRTIAFLEAGDYLKASVEMLDSKWAAQVSNRAIRLSHMMKEGVWWNER
jgi:lysozyme